MKKILFSLTIVALVMAACNSNNKAAEDAAKLQAYKDSIRMAADTAGLAQFQAWKVQNELANSEMYNNQTEQAAYTAPVRRSSGTSARRTTSRSSSGGSGTMNSSSAGTASRKKGWSKAAKGAVIGGAGGAVLGAVINKRNRVAGGVIGGVLGAGVGYGIGRSQDKKDGRN